MLLLAIDTCGPLGTVALARLAGGRIEILGETELPGKTWSVRLVPAIHELLGGHNSPLDRIGAVIMTSGPGSFTGIRIGLSTAKGLAEARSIPLIAVSRLAVLAHKAQVRAAALDAGRGEFYLGDFSGEKRESLLTRGEFEEAASAQGQNLAVCEASALGVAAAATRVPAPTAADALLFALPRIDARDFDDPVALDGHYLRRSDAEIFSKPKLSMVGRS